MFKKKIRNCYFYIETRICNQAPFSVKISSNNLVKRKKKSIEALIHLKNQPCEITHVLDF